MKTYSFDDADRSIVFHRHDLPMPWINYLSNGNLHAFVSQAGGGLCWWKCPVTYRMTRYRAYNLPVDSPGFYVYIRQKNGATWSPSFRPCETSLDSWECRHRPGITSFRARKGSLEATLELFMAPDQDVLVWDLEIRNNGKTAEDVDVFGYVELSQLQLMNEMTYGYYQKWAVRVFHDAGSDSVISLNYYRSDPPKTEPPLVYFASDRKSASHACNRDSFCGQYRDERNPAAVDQGKCDNADLHSGEGCAALQVRLSVPAGKCEKTAFFLGVTPGALQDFAKAVADTRTTLAVLRQPGFVNARKKKSSEWWKDHLDVYQCAVPDPDVERQINTWNPLQCVHTGRYSRSISQSAQGFRGIGFRDTAQDMLAIAYRKPGWAKKMLKYLCTQQYEDGHSVLESFPERNQQAWESVRSDTHLWPQLLAYAIAAETGDASFVDEKTPFLSAKDLQSPVGEATIWDHLMLAFQFTERKLGAHGLPLILNSDWNDHFGTFGRKGRGETVFAAQQYVWSLRKMIELAAFRKDESALELLNALLEKQCKVLDAVAWDGDWWLRGFDDDGRPVGTASSERGRVWLNTQSWAVLSGTGSREQLEQGMNAVRQNLDTDVGIRIFVPGYPTYPEVPQPSVKWLAPGCAENAGIFCQANAWAVMAEALLGRADNAWKYYRQLIPHVALKAVGLERYQAEAYAYVSTILSMEHERGGWANVNQVTGTAAWMDVAATQYLLGVQARLEGLAIDPCIPASWKGFEVTRLFRGCRIGIEVKNDAGVQKGIAAISIDGQALDLSRGPLIPASLLAGRQSVKVTAVMGESGGG